MAAEPPRRLPVGASGVRGQVCKEREQAMLIKERRGGAAASSSELQGHSPSTSQALLLHNTSPRSAPGGSSSCWWRGLSEASITNQPSPVRRQLGALASDVSPSRLSTEHYGTTLIARPASPHVGVSSLTLCRLAIGSSGGAKKHLLRAHTDIQPQERNSGTRVERAPPAGSRSLLTPRSAQLHRGENRAPANARSLFFSSVIRRIGQAGRWSIFQRGSTFIVVSLEKGGFLCSVPGNRIDRSRAGTAPAVVCAP